MTMPRSTALLATTSSLLSDEPPSVQSLIQSAKELYKDTFSSDNLDSTLLCTVAPGRVNLIGEHIDYTQGFVFPMAIQYSTVCLGKGSIVSSSQAKCRIVSSNKKSKKVVIFESGNDMKPLPLSHDDAWSNYVAGVVHEYMHLLPESTAISLEIAICGNVPLGSGLSSSAALEVAVATFLEAVIRREFPELDMGGLKDKAIRCQRAENLFCSSPCGIMDQYVSSTATKDCAILIDCRSLEYESVHMGDDLGSSEEDKPVFVVCNSNVKHSIGGGEYPVRVKQCAEATKILKSTCGDHIQSLRDATLADVELAHKKRKDEGSPAMDDIIYRRAKHVVTENERTRLAKEALMNGDWTQFGKLMNESHESMKSDYNVSCEEIDFLVSTAQNFEGVYGSRLTGGGFGGCTVSLVKRSKVGELCEYLTSEYKNKWNKECTIIETSPGPGAREIMNILGLEN
jgi:galactokinase